jgi:DNA gyrase/topoisomerase IV subunit A
LIDTQGNWGNIYTGDSAAAARYIEARLTPFALEVVLILKQRNGQNLMTAEITNRLIFP